MGIIAKQTLRGSVFIYMGIALGFVTTGLLFPRFLSVGEIGAINLILKYAAILSILANLGFTSVGAKLFPFFRDKTNGNNGYLKLNLLVSLFGFLVCCLIFIFFQDFLIRQNQENSPIFSKYLHYILPFTLSVTLFNILNTYNRGLYNAVAGTFLKELVQRVFILIGILLIIFNLISFQLFIPIYYLATLVPIIGLLWILNQNKELQLKPFKHKVKGEFKKELIAVSLFGILNNAGATIVTAIDTIMVNEELGENQAGVYATVALFSTVIIAPSRPLISIATTFLADAWKANDLNKIKELYTKSSINQLLFGSLIFIGIWANIDNIFNLIPEKFNIGKDVVFFLGLGALVNMIMGLNSSIIAVSKLFKWQAYFLLAFTILIIFTNYLLIPEYGIIGAGIASLISITIHNLLKFVFVLVKFKMQPFTKETILMIVIGIGVFFIQQLIPSVNGIIDLPIRSVLITLVFTLIVYPFKISEDFNRQVDKLLSLIRSK